MIGAFIASQITGKSILKYTLLPEVGPRIKNIFAGGFANLAYFMVLVYQAVKLLPVNHPYLKSSNMGHYSIRDVLSEASKNVHFDLKHIDQIIVFFALIAGIIILGIQFFLLLIAFLINPASAQVEMPSGFGEFFTTANPKEDLAFRLLDSVFGVPDLFGSKELLGGEAAFHTALHGLFQLYSIGLLIIAAMLIIYFIFAVLAETAQTGTPFGKRYNHAWVPIRLVVAIGLLIPVSYGLNSGQWITLYAAKMGSGFATNGWNKFNEVLQDENTLGGDKLVAEPNVPDLKDLSAFMMIAHACKVAYLDIDEDGNFLPAATPIHDIKAYLINPGDGGAPSKELLSSTFYNKAVEYSENKMIYIRFGEKKSEYTESAGNVKPYCGDLVLIIPDPITKNADGVTLNSTPYNHINREYFRLVKKMWNTDYQTMSTKAKEFMEINLHHNTDYEYPEASLKSNITNEALKQIKVAITKARKDVENDAEYNEQYKKYGWGGAGIFYNQIADINGRITNAVMNKPQIKAYPNLMTYVCEENNQNSANTSAQDCYNPNLPEGDPLKFINAGDGNIAKALSDLHDYWHKDPDGMTGNGIVNLINVMFGTQGLFDMCKNADVHPLAQLSSLGKGLVESAIRNIGIGLGLGLGSIIPVVGPTLGAISKMAMTFASIGILIGFMLYYLVPFMPFLYFMFAVGGWIKGLFEAMVGVPLWALSHIRIDGQGLPGDGGINGYFLIFEIFIRPILIVFGLIAAVITFGAMIKVLNEVFGIVINNLSGNDPTLGEACFQNGGGAGADKAEVKQSMADSFRGPIDEFFYTIVYAILVYMIGMASFKLIDLIPNNILRWMGQGLQTFNDQAGEPADGLMSKMAIGGGVLGGQLQQAGSAGGQAIAGLGKAGIGMFQNKE